MIFLKPSSNLEKSTDTGFLGSFSFEFLEADSSIPYLYHGIGF